MRQALIGHTGFVGGTLRSQHHFTEFYNSKNFMEMKNQKYDLIVCAGVSAVKWMAKKEPEKDREGIKRLENVLKTIEARNFILISTIDVYPLLTEKNEDYICLGVDNHAYGRHRLDFEIFCSQTFSNHRIIRLPGLFGKGLKKNVVYDLLNDNCLEMINVKSSFQYYNLKYIWQDIQTTIKKNIKLINLVTEPIKTGDILETFFPSKTVGQKASQEAHYNLYTRYAHHWGQKRPYIYTKDEMMNQLSQFFDEYKNDPGKK